MHELLHHCALHATSIHTITYILGQPDSYLLFCYQSLLFHTSTRIVPSQDVNEHHCSICQNLQDILFMVNGRYAH
jgi:hypothetical protein